MKHMMIAGLAVAAVLIAAVGCNDQKKKMDSTTSATNKPTPAAKASPTPAPAATPTPSPAPAAGAWKEAFKADFKGDKPDTKVWLPVTDDTGLKLDKGNLLIEAPANKAAVVVLIAPTFDAPSVRMEFVASFEKTEKISDLSVMFNVSKAGDFNDGYLFQFGGKDTPQNGLIRSGDSIDSTVNKKMLPLEAGKKYTVVVENDKGALKMTVNGTTVVEYKDAQPISGPKNGQVGFYTWGSKLRIESLSVSTKK